MLYAITLAAPNNSKGAREKRRISFTIILIRLISWPIAAGCYARTRTHHGIQMPWR